MTRILPDYERLSLNDMREAIGVAIGAASVCWDPMDATGVFMEERAGQIVDELFELVNKYAVVSDKNITEDPTQKIPLITYAGGIRMVIGEAEIIGEEILARIPLANLELGVTRSLKAEAAKGLSMRKTEIIFKPAEMITGVLFPVDLRFQTTGKPDDI